MKPIQFIYISLFIFLLLVGLPVCLGNQRRLRALNTQTQKSTSSAKEDAETAAVETTENLPGMESLPGLEKETVQRSMGHMGAAMAMTPNIDLSSLLPSYRYYIEDQVYKKVAGQVDYSKISNLQSFDFNPKHKALLMPYDPKYKLGEGFDVQNLVQKSAPFFLNPIYDTTPQSLEGQDGTIKVTVSKSVKELSENIASESEIYGSAWGIEAKAKFSYSNNENLKTNEVLLRATHSIDLGKSLIDPGNFLLTANAITELATDRKKFESTYGTHFIVGAKTACSMVVNYKKKVVDEQQKTSIAASLEVDYNSLSSPGVNVGGKQSNSYSKEAKDFSKNVSITVKYLGANSNKIVEGLDVKSLQEAILNFPVDCTGDINAYILWPYEQCQSYAEVKDLVDQELQRRKDKKRLEDLVKAAKAKIKDRKQRDKLLIQEWNRYNDQKKKEAREKQAAYKAKLSKAKKLETAAQLLDQLFLQAVLEAKITRVGLEQQPVDPKLEKQKQDDMWNLKIREVKLFYMHKKYTRKMNKLEKNEKKLEAGWEKLLDKAKKEVAAFQNKTAEFKKFACSDKNCISCDKYSPSICRQCKNPLALVQGQCKKSCPAGQYKKSGTCDKCHPFCSICYGGDVSTCKACSSGKFLQGTTCSEACSPGFVPKESKCEKCSVTCETYKSGTCDCMSCPKGEFEKDSQCVKECGAGYFAIGKNCQKCKSGCATCLEKAEKCQTCQSEYLMHVGKNTCEKSCEKGWAKNGNKCTQCAVSGCLAYDNKCQCTQCQAEKFVKGGKCVSSCGNKHLWKTPSGSSGGACIKRNCKQDCSFKKLDSLNDDSYGVWKPVVQEDPKKWAVCGMAFKQGSNSDWGTVGIKFIYCQKDNWNTKKETIISDEYNTGSYSGSWTDNVMCPYGKWVIGSRVRYNYSTFGHSTSINGLKFKCSSGDWRLVTAGWEGDWQDAKVNNGGWRVCGAQVRVEVPGACSETCSGITAMKQKSCRCKWECAD